MESTCVDIPRKKRSSRGPQPGEDSPDDSPPEVTTAIVFENKIPQSPSDKVWKDTFAELFTDDTPDTSSVSVPSTPSSSGFFPQSLLFTELLSADSDTNKTSFQSVDFLNSDSSSSTNSLYDSLKKDYQELKSQMEDLRQSNVVLEDKLNGVTQEVTEMRIKMQQMLNLLLGLYSRPQNNNNNSSKVIM